MGTLSACVGGPPPPPPTDPHDVMVVGDSVAFSLGCVLGDDYFGNGGPCPARPGYTTTNQQIGACTIWGTVVTLHNGGTAGVPNCDTVGAGAEGLTWAQMADKYVPKVVVIDSSGWEIVDKWINCPPFCGDPPDAQWGGDVNGGPYSNAAVYYSSALFDAINMFRSKGAQVLVANAPYAAPIQPEPPPGTVPDGLQCSWWEPDNPTAPTAQGESGNPLTCPGTWGQDGHPGHGLSYRSGHTKLDQFNAIVQQTLTNYFGGDPGVRLFNTKKHFNLPAIAGGGYTDYVCPPPNDGVVAPDPITHTCITPGPVPAILARAIDHSHLSSGGQFDVLQPYLEPCVKGMLGIGGGDLSKCS